MRVFVAREGHGAPVGSHAEGDVTGKMPGNDLDLWGSTAASRPIVPAGGATQPDP